MLARRLANLPSQRDENCQSPCEFSDEELPFWAEEPKSFQYRSPDGQLLTWEVSLVVPNGQEKPKPETAKLPMIVYFAGLCSRGGVRDANIPRFQERVSGPFVVVAPVRKKGRWWCIDSEKEPAGFIEGNYMPSVVDAFVEWIRSLSEDPSIDKDSISLCGFSAGAYAVTEIAAANSHIDFRAVLVGGVHGHSQPDFKDVPEKLHNDTTLCKWKAYLDRIRKHSRPSREFLVVHHPEDEMCPWRYAEELCRVFDERRRELGASPLQIELIINMPKSKKNKSAHAYHDKAILHPTFFSKLFREGIAKEVYREESMFRRITLNQQSGEQAGGKAQAAVAPAGFQEHIRATVSEAVLGAVRKRARKEDRDAAASEGSPTAREWLDSATRAKESPEWSPAPEPRKRENSAEVKSRYSSTSARRPSAEVTDRLPLVSVCTNAATPRESRRSIPAGQSSDRENLMCANPSCWFVVHSDKVFGGFCCRKCHWRFESGSKCKKKHGELCAQREAPPGAVRAKPDPPDSPMTM